jgi:hypothetical protein
MGFDLGRSFNGGAEWLCDSKIVGGALSNPVITALLITALALIIVHVMYKKRLKGTGWQRGVKTAFWLVIGVSALVFVHYYALKRKLQKEHASVGLRNVVNSVQQSAAVGGGYPVLPGFGGGNESQAEGVAPQTERIVPPGQGPITHQHRPNNVSADSVQADTFPELEEVSLDTVIV